MRGWKDEESWLVAFIFCFVKFWEHISSGVYSHVKKIVSELINGPGAVIMLYWAPDGTCDCIVVQVGFWIELLVQMRLCPILVKLWLPINGTQRCDVELHNIHRLSVG